MADGDRNDLDRLEELARERWGERWTITQKHFADGTTKQTAWRTYGPVDVDDDGQVFDIERIRLEDDEVLHDRVYQRNDDVVEVIDYEVCGPDEISELDTPEHTKK
ncbi:hypothetical protein [Natrinema salaciae]|uniref:Uncharacterized protein n=1 Tax=Natrinema salaciae TaxID=1186196 RepID=A0A1H9EVZ4_9EURY|nr:hypothetical protein [Natrinema salaciae]SEQ29757.1 hypothetical protein SAMN04489841_1396 [Natrinema salaciae]